MKKTMKALLVLSIFSVAIITNHAVQAKTEPKKVTVIVKYKYYDTKAKKTVTKTYKTYKVKKGSKFSLSWKKLPAKTGNSRVDLKPFKVTKNVTKTVSYKKLALGEQIANEAKKLVGGKAMSCDGAVGAAIVNVIGQEKYRDNWSVWYMGKRITNKSELQTGDVLLYPGHQAIYIGNGQAVHGGWSGKNVVIASMELGKNQPFRFAIRPKI